MKLVIILALVAAASLVAACGPSYPSVYSKSVGIADSSGLFNCFVYYPQGLPPGEHQANASVEYLLARDCGLSGQEAVVVRGFLERGLSVKEQSDSEYADYLLNVSAVNSTPGCPTHGQVERSGKWTAYGTTGVGVVDGLCVSLLNRGCGGGDPAATAIFRRQGAWESMLAAASSAFRALAALFGLRWQAH